eukprot:CAMPEP_0115183326 /NCGR_PEP_ID=MMETSP0270-20121206/8397_1 /TAXON_ID=71861 /ORGANISM="Scrippsiella trochoidea, Strain CCMP3099" /LENGTH=61 /DNA_ID=CAMNT_0002596393 /DNA_START=1161 /DNA_END=1342 /DNA_ORIENTATION=+
MKPHGTTAAAAVRIAVTRTNAADTIALHAAARLQRLWQSAMTGRRGSNMAWLRVAQMGGSG